MKEKKAASLLDALTPVVCLILMLAASVYLYGDNSSYGANQIALLLAASITMLIGYKNGFGWKELEQGIVKGISMALGAVLILLMVGSLIGTWILAGTVPSMIYYGMQVLEPSFFYAATCLICALVSVSIGSSWTTAGTIGVALIGIAVGLNLSLPITAGAIISGAYFGDKMSPLSDTTNLAPAIAGSELFSHIRHMAWTTGPSILVAVVLFAVIGFTSDAPSVIDNSLEKTLSAMSENFSISVFSLLPLFLVFFLAYKKMPAFPTLLIGALVGGIFAVLFQASAVEKMVSSSIYTCSVSGESASLIESCSVKSVEKQNEEYKATFELTQQGSQSVTSQVILNAGDSAQKVAIEIADEQVVSSLAINLERRAYWINAVDAVWQAMFKGHVATTGNGVVDELLSRGGMKSMLNTIWLILCAMAFGAALETVGLLQRLVTSALVLVKGTGSLVVTVITTCIGINIIAADQYIAIVLPGRMYRAEFKKRQLEAKNLSRTLEDSATITSPLIPWNTCGAFMAGTLGVATFAYLPFCFFNLINPIVSIIYGITHFKITKLSDELNETAKE